MISPYLRRGLLAGLFAGLLAGLFAFAFGEPSVEAAIQLEEAAASGHDHGEGAAGSHSHEGEIVSRSTQSGVGLFITMGIFGATVGGLFGIAFAFFRSRLAAASEWARSLSLAGAIFAGVFLIPYLKYPANPPTVGDPATIGDRTAAYLAMVGLSLLVVLAAWYAARTLRERGTSAPVRQLSVGLGVALAVGVLFVVFPAAPAPGDFPSGLLWSFRLSSLGTQIAFWAGLAVVFGLLGERASRQAPRQAPLGS